MLSNEVIQAALQRDPITLAYRNEGVLLNDEVLAGAITDLKTAKFRPGMFQSTTRKEGDTVVVVVASRDLPRDDLRKRTLVRATIEKYRLKAQRCIGFGVMANDPSQVFDSAIWFDEPWKYDSVMEELIADEPPFVPALGVKKPGRNLPCQCGSGLKFKRCCLRRYEAGLRIMRNDPERPSN